MELFIELFWWIVVGALCIYVGYRSHVEYTKRKTGTTKIIRGTWWDGVKIFFWIIVILLICAVLF